MGASASPGRKVPAPAAGVLCPIPSALLTHGTTFAKSLPQPPQLAEPQFPPLARGAGAGVPAAELPSGSPPDRFLPARH